MEIYEVDTIKMEKEKAMRRYRTFKKIGYIVRTVEVFVAIMLISISISWTSNCVPSVCKFCRVFFRRVSSVFFSPHFVFLIGNVIIITLFASFSSSEKSGHDESPLNADVTVNTEVESDDVNIVPALAKTTYDTAVEKEKEEVEAAVVEENRESAEKVHRRTQSAVARMEVTAVTGRELVKSEVSAEAAAEVRRRRMFEEDELSSEDFRRKVEQFIEKQQRFLREERKGIVLSNNHNFTASKYSRSRSM